ncbi:glycosyltransferase family 39 protein [Nostoc cycadae]|uniref:Dolichyl-phosphate-mannose-protein mannosyltransferase n=1 Tax=Nostoc cycadae WK-1 TaxID=1861711 RepID=A0A2H6LJR7_9NOSO|nr:glycosyltransferase family 39 protein [Nostoc cycadae]GBE93458.1 dolichyl-phosphate-mannose-protein mannosyltransferase [Nostoc cycadae WK-1]
MKFYSGSLRFLIISVLALGLFFRFVNLDKKIYSYDETFTSLRISGYTEKEIAKQAFNGQEIHVSDLQKFQHPNIEKGVIDTVKGLAQEEPQLTPLYFVIARLWTGLFGGSVAVTRSLAAIISLLALPCAYWLCRELFESPLVGWMAVLLIAVSPLHILFAQESRMYSLWIVTTLLSGTCLLRAIKLNTRTSWVIYAITLALGLYSHLLTVLTAIGHGIYVILAEKFKFTKTTISYLLALFSGILLFSPWIFVLVTRTDQAEIRLAWANTRESFFFLVRSWSFQSSRLFLDLNVNRDSNPLFIFLISPTTILLLILVGYSIYFIYKKSFKLSWLFVIIAIFINPLIFITKDLLQGGILSTYIKYLTPSLLAMQIAVAYLLAKKITDVSVSSLVQKFWRSVTTVILLCGILSCSLSSQASNWWNKGEGDNKYNLQVAHIINQSVQPLVIGSGLTHNDKSFVGIMLSLSHLLEPQVRLRLTVEPKIPTIPNESGDIFIYRPPNSLLRKLKNKYELKPAWEGKDIWLWRLKK